MKRKNLEFIISVLIYLFTAFASSVCAYLILRDRSKLTLDFLQGNAWVTAVLPVMLAECVAMVLSFYNGRYAFRRTGFFYYIGKSVISTLYFTGVWAVILLIQKNSITDSRYFFVTTVFLHFVILALSLYIGQCIIIANFYKTSSATQVGIVTTKEQAADISDTLKHDWTRKISGIMLVNESMTEAHSASEEIDHVPVVADSENLVEWVSRNAIDEIFMVVPDIEAPFITDAAEKFVQMGITVYLNLPSVEHYENRLKKKTVSYVPRTRSELSFISDIPMLVMTQPQMRIRDMFLKRLLDIIGGLIGSLITAIMFVIVGIAIKIDSPGPVIFSQVRVGKNGRKFNMYKFRSMYQDAEKRKAALMEQNEMNGLMFKMKDDPRITRVGKFIRRTSIDEFPQFFNVLKGDMSLVGTRPPIVAEYNEYSPYHRRRLSMKPGITGLWQVSGRSDIKDFEYVVSLDCEYIDNWSLLGDIKILWKTIGILFKKQGAE